VKITIPVLPLILFSLAAGTIRENTRDYQRQFSIRP
jgi:hypothetical protein